MAVPPPRCSAAAAWAAAAVRSVTRSPDAAASRSAVLVSAITLPRPTITRWPAVSCSSPIRWLDTSTARPSAASARRNPRIQMMPSGSMPLNGSSNITADGSPSIAAAIPSRWRIPSEYPPALRRAADCIPVCSITASTRRAGRPWELGQPEQVVAAGAAGLQRRGVQQRAQPGQRPAEGPVGPPADQRAAFVGGVQAEDHPHRGGLARAVRADEPGHLPRRHGKRHPVQRHGGPEPLAQAVDFDGCLHAPGLYGNGLTGPNGGRYLVVRCGRACWRPGSRSPGQGVSAARSADQECGKGR